MLAAPRAIGSVLSVFHPSALDAELRFPGDPALARIEEAGLNASQPPRQLLIDGWLLRFSPGKARRARSVNAIGAGRLSLDEKLALCRHWYEQFRLPLLMRVTPFSQPAALDDYLEAAGFIAFDETRVMACPLEDLDSGASKLLVEPVDVDRFAQAVGELRASPRSQLDAHRARLLAAPLLDSTIRLVAYEDSASKAPVAAGQVVVERNLAGLYDIVTAEQARGRGLGRALSQRLLEEARTMGATIAYLQVDAGNAPARRIYSALGFVDRYAYWYRRPADATDETLL